MKINTINNSKNILIIIPAFNEERSLPSVISDIKRLDRNYSIIVINDGSTDKTREVIENLGVNVLNQPLNQGYGGAIQAGLKFANKNKFNTVVLLDADGQHNPKYLPMLLDKLASVDMVIGSRYIKPTNYKTSFRRLIAIKYFSHLVYWIYKVRIHDPNSGYQVLNKKVIDFFSEYHIQDFAEPPRIVSVLLNNKYKIREISVEMRPRISGNSSITWYYGIYLLFSNSFSIIREYFNK